MCLSHALNMKGRKNNSPATLLGPVAEIPTGYFNNKRLTREKHEQKFNSMHISCMQGDSQE